MAKNGIIIGQNRMVMMGSTGKLHYYGAAQYMAMSSRMAGMSMAGGAALGAGAGAAAAAGAQAGAKVATTIGSRVLGFLGGPWGIAITMGLPFIISLLGSNNDEQKKQTELLEESLSSSELKNLEDKALIDALRAACRDGIIDGVGSAKPVPVEVTVEGGGNYTNVNIDGSNDFNIWE